MTGAVGAARVLTPEGVRERLVVELDAGRITALREARPGEAVHDGLMIPGLVNAHTHLELGWAAGRVPGGHGFPAWGRELMALPGPSAAEREAGIRAGAAELVVHGTAAVCDVSNRGDTGPAVAAAGLVGVVQHELLDGLDPDRLALCGPALIAPVEGPVPRRPSPHALFSSSPALIGACLAVAGPPSSVHVAEDPAELTFLAEGRGPFADLLDALGRRWRGWTPPGVGPARTLDRLGALGPRLLLVHGVHLDRGELALVAERGASLCLCPRSNLHVGGRLPDVPAALAAGVHLCLGTDSLASCPDLDVLAEVALLTRAFPEVPLETWLFAATAGGADALGLPDLGRIEVGRAPGLVLLDRAGAPPWAGPPPRWWVARPGSDSVERPAASVGRDPQASRAPEEVQR